MRSFVDGQSTQRANDNIMETPLSKLFFSKGNLDRIQKNILAQIKKNGYTISRQPDANVYRIMRWLYINMWHDDYNNVNKQVNEMNRLTVKEASRVIMEELLLYLDYLKRVDTNPVPVFDRPQLMSQQGTRSFDIGPSDGLTFQNNELFRGRERY